jgi:hypothetical protein
MPRAGRDLALSILATIAVVFALEWAQSFVISLLLGILFAYTLELVFPPKHGQGLDNAHPADLMDAEISPSGHGCTSRAWTRACTQNNQSKLLFLQWRWDKERRKLYEHLRNIDGERRPLIDELELGIV